MKIKYANKFKDSLKEYLSKCKKEKCNVLQIIFKDTDCESDHPEAINSFDVNKVIKRIEKIDDITRVSNLFAENDEGDVIYFNFCFDIEVMEGDIED